MSRKYFAFGLGLVSMAIIAVLSFMAPPLPAETYFGLVALASLITVATSSPAPVRSFLRRLAARTDDPVPSTI